MKVLREPCRETAQVAQAKTKGHQPTFSGGVARCQACDTSIKGWKVRRAWGCPGGRGPCVGHRLRTRSGPCRPATDLPSVPLERQRRWGEPSSAAPVGQGLRLEPGPAYRNQEGPPGPVAGWDLEMRTVPGRLGASRNLCGGAPATSEDVRSARFALPARTEFAMAAGDTPVCDPAETPRTEFGEGRVSRRATSPGPVDMGTNRFGEGPPDSASSARSMGGAGRPPARSEEGVDADSAANSPTRSRTREGSAPVRSMNRISQ